MVMSLTDTNANGLSMNTTSYGWEKNMLIELLLVNVGMVTTRQQTSKSFIWLWQLAACLTDFKTKLDSTHW